MSSSDPTTSILLTDKPDQVKNKINKYAFSGGGATLEEHKEKGANLDVDVPYQYLEFFFEDDARLAEIKEKYGKGEMMTGEVKNQLISCLNEFLKEVQGRRSKVTNETVKQFMTIRPIDAIPRKWKEEKAAAEEKKE